MARQRVTVFETFGLTPLRPAVREAWRAIRGENELPGTQWDLSSLRILKPRISLPTWAGRVPADRRMPIYNFVNRVPAPRDQGYSVKVTFARDFRGGQWTYDGHIGTDFAAPVGTPVAAAAPGKVLRVASHMDHGGLKVVVDHGEGLATTYGHLSRALTREGELLGRGQVLGLSGASGVEFLLFFPWVAPHLHLNVLLDGFPVDPFAAAGEDAAPLWVTGNDPVPFRGDGGEPFEPTPWDRDLLDAAIQDCADEDTRFFLRNELDTDAAAGELLFQRNLRAPLFRSFPPLYRGTGHARRPVLDLPFRSEDYDRARFPQDGASP